MAKNYDKALEFLLETIKRHAQVDLTDEQKNAALQVLRLMPKGATLRDFENACLGTPNQIVEVSMEAKELLQPLALALQQNNSYAGQFAALFEEQISKEN